MPIAGITKTRGLDTFNNSLELGDTGYLIQADDINIDRNNIIESRRGFVQYGAVPADSNVVPEQLITYKDRVLVHYPKVVSGVFQGNHIAYDDGNGVFTDFTGTYDEASPGTRIKFVEQNGNLYFTTSAGIKKISAVSSTDLSTAVVTNVGAPKALGLELSLDTTIDGFLSAQSKVAYRVVWGLRDANNNLLLGYPSPSVEIDNPGSYGSVVKVKFYVPQEVTTSHFYQIYRTQVAALASGLNDELNLVYEAQHDGSSFYEIQDIYSEDLRISNTSLYTNATSGEGISQANEKPPIAQDISTYKKYTFFSNTISRESSTNTLLGLGLFEPLTTDTTSSVYITGVSFPTSSTVRITFNAAHGLSVGDKVVVSGILINTTSDSATGLKVITAKTANTIDYSSSTTITSISQLLGGAVVYTQNIQTIKGSTTNRYWPIGRQSKFQFKFDNNTGSLTPVVAASTLSQPITVLTNGTEVRFTSVGTLTGVITGVTYYVTSAGPTTFKLSSTWPTITAVTFGGTVVTIPTLTFNLKTYLDDEYITIQSADKKVTYNIWFDSTGLALIPTSYTLPTNTVKLKVDTSANLITDNMAQTFVDFISANVFDFEAELTTANGNIVALNTSSSGVCDEPSVTSVVHSNITIGTGSTFITQVGIGTTFTPKDISYTNDNYFLLSSYLLPGEKNSESTNSLLNAINSNTNDLIYGFYTSSTQGLPGEFSLESRTLDTTSFTLTSNSSAIREGTFNTVLPQTSSSESNKNRVYFSKQYEPDAVPIANYFDVGPKDKPIRRIIGLRESLFIFKDEGIYRLSGENSNLFQVILFDSSSNIAASDTATVLNNQIYLLTTQGVARVSETGVEIISRPIENKFNSLQLNPNYTTASFGLGYEADRCYLLFVPDNTSDTTSTCAYRFSTFTQTWTRWVKNYQCGIVHPTQNKLYFGAVEDNYIEVERKTLTRKDYSDRVISGKQILVKSGTDTITISNNGGLVKGDSFVQIQKVTVDQYNLLIDKLMIDPKLTGISLASASACSNIGQLLLSLVTQLNIYDTTPVTPYVASGNNDFTVLQSEYNAIVNKLNSSSGVFFIDYKLSTGTTEIEAHIKSFSVVNNQVVLDQLPPFIVGNVLVEKGIPSILAYHPMHFGDPTIWKHVREGRVLFESTNFEGGTVGYNTDLSNNFEDMDFYLEGSGAFGNQTWDDFTWGGTGQQTPVRTLIPRQKQRCRFIRTRIKHSSARDKFAVYGIYYVFESGSERAYKG